MGNRVLCADAGFRCTENCRRISRQDAVVAEHVFGGCDPAGAVFDETLEGLRDLDRQLILFSSSSNVVAVRWLLEMGASQETCDSNATSCLHAACRSGSVGVVQSLLDARSNVDTVIVSARGSQPTLNAADISGWTPLHISVFMGRPDVSALLLNYRARLDRKNKAEQTPLDLCNDSRTRMILLAPEQLEHRGVVPTKREVAGGTDATSDSSVFALESSTREFETNEDDVASSAKSANQRNMAETVMGPPPTRAASPNMFLGNRELRFEPFFVPRVPAVPTAGRDEEVLRRLTAIGESIFNRQPGRGLSFLVATGCTRDYPIDLVAMLRGNNFDLHQIGTFLGEDFSLSKILRMEFINSISVMHSSVSQALDKAFANFKAPTEMRKVDRILSSLAEVWWRQHERKPMANIAPVKVQPPISDADDDWSVQDFNDQGDLVGASQPSAHPPPEELDEELEGFELRRLLSGPESLHQILFSTMMLHATAHAGVEDQRVNLARWLEINDCFADIPRPRYERVMRPIHQHVRKFPIPNVGDWHPQKTKKATPHGQSIMEEHAQVEGWARILGDAMPLLGMRGEEGGASGVWQMFSEATASSRRWHPDGGASSLARIVRDEVTARSTRSGRAGAAAVNGASTRGSPGPRGDAASSGRAKGKMAHHQPPAPDVIWISLCSSMLFFSVDPTDGSPFAFIHLGRVQFASIEPAHKTIALDGGPDPTLAAASVARSDADDSSDKSRRNSSQRSPSGFAGAVDAGNASDARLPLWLVFLLPDGRWQSFEVPQLVLEICEKSQLEAWVLKLSELSVNLGANWAPRNMESNWV